MIKGIFVALLFVSVLSCKKDTISDKLVEASCGQCQFSMEGSGCDLAIRMDDKSYYVEGTDIDDHGDAHASDGFCEAIKKAKVSGRIVDGKFVTSSFKIIHE